MIPKDCKRLAEVDFPIAEVSRHAVAENAVRHGHPKALHLWWARRPLASSRAILLGLLWPDPCDPLCPKEFKEKARELLRQVAGCNPGTTDEELRKALLKFIADFANWGLASNRTYLDVSRALVKIAHGEEPPLVVDPFAGGGSIPFEALRLGCEAFASDLNPVACLILKVMLEEIPRHGPKLVEELRHVGAEIMRQAEGEMADLYPKDADGATPIAYLWARTIRCESPNCGAEIPLVRSFWLSEKAKRRRALRHRVVRLKNEPPRVEFETFEPKAEKDVPLGTVSRAKATCICCGVVLPPARVRAQLAAQRGGADIVLDRHGNRRSGAMLLAVATHRPDKVGRYYRLPNDQDYKAIRAAQLEVAAITSKERETLGSNFPAIPDEPLSRVPVTFGVINVWVYGMLSWGDLFTTRQKAALLRLIRTLSRLASSKLEMEVLVLAIGRVLRHCNVVSKWHRGSETVAGAFGMQAIPMSWDFPEMVPLATQAGGLENALNVAAECASGIGVIPPGMGQAQAADAAEHPLPDSVASVWFTDPPYYDAVPYSYLSDFFYIWMRRSLGTSNPTLFSNTLTPKEREIVAYIEEGKTAGTAYENYERRMSLAFAEGHRVLREDGIGSVVFAHKTTEGWEALLSGMHKAGWTVSASWPVATERGARLRARDSAALATSVHLICRPRAEDASIGDWADVLRELPKRVSDWMDRLQGEGVRGADLVFACIGPALEIFSRYAKVETADGREVGLPEYLEKVWEVVGRSALGQVLGTAEAKAGNGAAGAVEEDARLTALFLWTLQTTDGDVAEDAGEEREDEEAADDEEDEDDGASRGKVKGFTLVFDVVRRFAQPLGIELPKWEHRIIEIKKGIVRLLPIAERAKQLFGEDGASAVAARLEREAVLGPNPLQGVLFPEMEAAPKMRGRQARGRGGRVDVSDQSLAAAREATTLDRLHAAMLLQGGGRTNALRALLKAEHDRGPDFLRLANALSALYPKGSEEKRLLDAMLLAVPR
jgi:putative DNA methylase